MASDVECVVACCMDLRSWRGTFDPKVRNPPIMAGWTLGRNVRFRRIATTGLATDVGAKRLSIVCLAKVRLGSFSTFRLRARLVRLAADTRLEFLANRQISERRPARASEVGWPQRQCGDVCAFIVRKSAQTYCAFPLYRLDQFRAPRYWRCGCPTARIGTIATEQFAGVD